MVDLEAACLEDNKSVNHSTPDTMWSRHTHRGARHYKLTGGPVGLMSRAKLVRWKHWQTVVFCVLASSTNVQPSVSQLLSLYGWR